MTYVSGSNPKLLGEPIALVHRGQLTLEPVFYKSTDSLQRVADYARALVFMRCRHDDEAARRADTARGCRNDERRRQRDSSYA